MEATARIGRDGLFVAEEAEFAGGAIGSQTVGKMKGGSGAGGDGWCADGRVWAKSTEGEKTGCFVEAEAGA